MEIKYEGYIKRENFKIKKKEKMETLLIPDNIIYENIQGLKIEAVEKLKKVKPQTIGQAMRISGVDPSHISLVVIHIEIINKKNK